MAKRGVVLIYKTVREWCFKVGRIYAKRMRSRCPCPGDRCISTTSFSRSVAGRSSCGVRLTRTAKCSTFWCNRGGISVRPSDSPASCSRL
jgi:hypothetical protein